MRDAVFSQVHITRHLDQLPMKQAEKELEAAGRGEELVYGTLLGLNAAGAAAAAAGEEEGSEEGEEEGSEEDSEEGEEGEEGEEEGEVYREKHRRALHPKP